MRTTKDDSISAAKYLNAQIDIAPWSESQVADLIESSKACGNLPLKPLGRSKAIRKDDLVTWFKKYILENTVLLDYDDYRRSQSFAYYDILVSGLDATDMGGNRQRSFGQHLENAIGGNLAEIAVAQFLESRGVEQAFLELGENTDVEDAKGADIVAIKEGGEQRKPNLKIQVKKSKPSSVWLPLERKDENAADAYVLARVGLPYQHLADYLKSAGLMDDVLVELTDEKKAEVIAEIPSFGSIPVHISGFAYWEDFRDGDLELAEKTKTTWVVGGIGKRPQQPPAGHDTDRVKVIKFSPGEDYIGAISALRNSSGDWEELIKAL